jgi:hypothetical protein
VSAFPAALPPSALSAGAVALSLMGAEFSDLTNLLLVSLHA